MELITKSAAQTRKIGAILAQTLKSQKPGKRSFIIALRGELGSGKTTFIKGFADGLGISDDVLSPTFLILKQFSLIGGAEHYKNLYHLDAYRLKNADELLDLGFEDLIKEPKNLIIIEWADKIQKLIPRGAIWIKFKNPGKNKRIINLKS
ncbi:MAG: tRNA (adenosine(37)-N6)-threonylcarbamoyltransferase complex ATPase subunit type 1 TsaE [Candidatus Colwellbacteria bacterium]|nr:tRNA (adenosine(37)-N6)-threonylcarbamoyltransferase complex ATPase subunit type 1 TsaE [Candidatus Colwellbacteria bacterium]